MNHYSFDRNTPIEENFFYVSSLTARSDTRFTREDDHLVNAYNESIGDYDYISILTRKMWKSGVRVSTRCSFDSFGAPLIVFTDDYRTDETGHNFYGLHFEVVAYENGINIWHIIPAPAGSERPIVVKKIAFAEFAAAEKTPLDLEVTVSGKTITARMNGHTLTAEHPDIPETVHVGLTACEGINRFYSFCVEGEET